MYGELKQELKVEVGIVDSPHADFQNPESRRMLNRGFSLGILISIKFEVEFLNY